jgi:phosphoribosylanthranilate isomerase
MTWIKICGTTNLADANLAIAAGADAVGFVFAPSPRQIQQELAGEIIDALPAKVEKIGVTVNQSPESVARLAQNIGLTSIQLQGDEPADKLRAYRSALAPRKIIKTLQAQQLLAGGDGYLYQYLRVSEFFDAVLLDAGVPGQPGGTGVRFDWNAVLPIATRIRQWIPVIVAGGLTSENVAEAIRLFAPWGVDVVSGVESEPRHKDEARLRNFVEAVRRADSSHSAQDATVPPLSQAGSSRG